MSWKTCRHPSGLVSLAIASLIAASASAAETPKALMLFSYLGDQAYVRQYNVAEGRAAQIDDVQIDVKAGTARGDVNFFIQEIVTPPRPRATASSP